ncbi:hypothetical protein ACIPLC_15600 [Kitasatospora sp. NPDC086801]|uniref:hypothetical protein n=1 Tax=unclassified Kitasatospora TaxID=2633591 RepID=UPI0037F66F3A
MDLHSYATALATHLPGTWAVEHHQDLDPDTADIIALLAIGPTIEFADFRVAAVLTSPNRPIGLLVTENPHSTAHAFTIRSIAPAGASSYANHAGGEKLELPGLGDPAAAAAEIERVLLPRHDQLLADDRLAVLEDALRGAQQAVDHWDAISDGLSDEQGWPLDDQLYGDGVVRRDADALRHIEHVLEHALPHADALLQDGWAAQAALPPGPAADRASWQLGELQTAFVSAAEILHRWKGILARTATVDGYKEALEERNAEAWHDVHTWLIHGPALTALLRSTAEPGGAIRSAAAQARSLRRVAGGPPGQAEPGPGPTSVKQAPEQRR